jgi:hypothetical protein
MCFSGSLIHSRHVCNFYTGLMEDYEGSDGEGWVSQGGVRFLVQDRSLPHLRQNDFRCASSEYVFTHYAN